jgi:hypothetical protein
MSEEKSTSIKEYLIDEKKPLHFLGFLLKVSLFLFVCLAFLFGIYKVFENLFPNTIVEKAEILGSSVVFSSKKTNLQYFLFSTNSQWETVIVDFEKGDSLHILASGGYHTALHHAYSYAKNDTGKLFDWIKADGIDTNDLKRAADRRRHSKSILPKEKYGALLVKFDYGSESDIVPFKGDELRYKCKSKCTRIYISVNEPILMPSDKDIYIIKDNIYCNCFQRNQQDNKKCLQECETRQEKSWAYLMKNQEQMKRLWFDDNIGQFLIVIEKRQK